MLWTSTLKTFGKLLAPKLNNLFFGFGSNSFLETLEIRPPQTYRPWGGSWVPTSQCFWPTWRRKLDPGKDLGFANKHFLWDQDLRKPLLVERPAALFNSIDKSFLRRFEIFPQKKYLGWTDEEIDNGHTWNWGIMINVFILKGYCHSFPKLESRGCITVWRAG